MPSRKRNYSLSAGEPAPVAAPHLDYRPLVPRAHRQTIALVGCGGIAPTHLQAYHDAGWRVVALCDIVGSRAHRMQREYAPNAVPTTDIGEILRDPNVTVVDFATPPDGRPALVERALRAGKHVLCQKPFADHVATANRLAWLAERQHVRLAVNQNGRWAPHLRWMTLAVRAGLIGDVIAVHQAVHWDHNWTAGTPFEQMSDLILEDFGIHWFDFAAQVLAPRRVETVLATRTCATGQAGAQPLMAQAIYQFEGGQGSIVFDGALTTGALDTTVVAGTRGAIFSSGPDLGRQKVTLVTAKGAATPRLQGAWFPDGFRGAMAELLDAIDRGREPENSVPSVIPSLELCYAAVRSSRTGKPVAVGSASSLPGRRAATSA